MSNYNNNATHPLCAYFAQQGFSDTDIEIVLSCFRLQEYQKGDSFVREGSTSQYLGFIESGFLQFFVVISGEEKTTYTVGENNFIASLISFLQQVPSRETIRAVTASRLWLIHRNDLLDLLQQVPAFNRFYLSMLEWQICCIDDSRLDSLLLSAEERYLKMLEKEPAVIQKVPLHYLAAILGVTPRHLSRIRNNIRSRH